MKRHPLELLIVRKHFGLREFAEKCNITRQALHKILRGQVKPTLQTRVAFADVLELDLSDIDNLFE